MQKAVGTRATFLVYVSFVALCSAIILAGMLLSPSEPGSSILFGLSLPRLFLAAALLAAFVFFLGLFVRSFKDQEWTEQTLKHWFDGGRFSQLTLWLSTISLGLGWIGCFLPSYRAGILGGYWTRLQPIMVFLLCAGIATLLVVLLRRSTPSIGTVRSSGTFKLALGFFTAILLLLGFMLISQYGFYAPEDFWYGAGVPILTLQLMGMIAAGLLFLLFVRTPTKRFDLIVVILLYVITASLWAREPLQKSFLFTEPRPPNQALYPFADSAAFDAGSQFALIGQGIFIFNSPFNDRPLYLSLLVFLHSLFGQNYELLMAAQAALFAVLSPLIYLIGRSLNMRAVGFAASGIATLRGINAIAGSSLIDMANPKMILSDFPAAIGVALIILFACEWLKKPEQKWHHAIWVGGAIGLTLMIRPHGLVILVLLPFYALLLFAPHWKKWAVACLLIGLGVLAVTLPWELRNVARGGIMYRSIVMKIQDVIRNRYAPPADTGSLTPPDASLVKFQTSEVLLSLYSDRIAQEQACNSLPCFAPKHFLHNIATSILVLPTSPILDDLRHTVKGDPAVWRADWQGNFTPSSLFFFVLNVFFIILGISVIWKRMGFVGLVPLAVFAIYILSNSVARTSGGRYIVPADWIITIYYLAGVLFLCREILVRIHKQVEFFDPENQESRVNLARSPWLTTLLVSLLLFGAGSVIPLSEKLHSARYADFDASRSLQEREAQIREAGLDMEQISGFLESPEAEILVGRTLYPRSYKLGQGETTFYFYPFTVMDFPRTGFFLIGPEGQTNILLPGGVPNHLPHAADVVVVGCKEENYVDALMVVTLDEKNVVYTRWPMPELSCPFKQPVCENNSTCE